MIGGALLVLKGGMFNGIIYSFRQFYKRTSMLEGYVSEQIGESPKSPINSSLIDLYMYPILISGASLFFFTLFITVI